MCRPIGPIMEERIVVHNRTDPRDRAHRPSGRLRAADERRGRQVLPELAADRFVAVPFRARPDDVKPYYNDFSTADLIDTKGYEVAGEF